MSVEIPREIPGQTPRRPARRHELARVQLAAVEARQQIVDYMIGVEDAPSEVQPEVQRDTVVAMKRSHGRKGDRAKRGADSTNELLITPGKFPPTPENKNILVNQFEKILRFAKTLRNKGKINPHMADILGLEVRKATKSSIVEQTR